MVRVMFCLVCLLAILPFQVTAQDDLYARWQAQQVEAVVQAPFIGFVEHAQLNMEAAFGPRRLRIDSRMAAVRGRPGFERVVVEADAGRQGRDRGDRRRMPPPIRPDLQRAADELLIPGRMAFALRLTEYTTEDVWEGEAVRGILLVPQDSSSTLERLTLWFGEESGELLRSRAFFTRADAGTLLSDIRYRRVNGIDVPVERTLEGSFRMRRRTRTFTIVMDSRATYDDHVFTRPRPAPR